MTHLELKRAHYCLASIASTATWMGIFATLSEIVASFKMESGKSSGLVVMSYGLSKALLPCASGLLVALSTMWCYRYLLSEVEELDSDMEIASLQLINDLGRLEWNRIEVGSNMLPIPKTEALYAARRASMRSAAVVRLELIRGLNVLASIATTAGWVGIVGVVLGICGSFGAFNGSKRSMIGDVYDGLSRAFLPCTFALLVALAAVWCYRFLLSEFEELDWDMENASLQLMNDLGRLNGA